MIWILLVAFILSTGVEGLYEGIDDITNNLATDLAPLITLFGEQATKQFLSESTSFKDSIIFSIAPLGLITTVVSVIRIYGSSSFKSIIGRSQEAHGVAEAELCSSTSQDVCELWSNGGICRVFGRPKILNFIYISHVNNDFYSKYRRKHQPQDSDIVEEGPSCGIHRPNSIFVSNDKKMKKNVLFEWEEVVPNRWRLANPFKLLSSRLGTKPTGSKGNDHRTDEEHRIEEQHDAEDQHETQEKHGTEDETFANPNLTLNIGIRKFPKTFDWSVLIFSMLLQSSFFGYATWATFYNPSFLIEGAPSPQAKLWFALTVLGTIMLVFGMILCARLIDLKSRERKFKIVGQESEIFWLQPGGQRIGDQLFHAFAYSEKRDNYITSRRLDNTERQRTLLLAVISTTLGWVLQFIGLRGSPGSVALFQFIGTLIMSFLRAMLRGKRLEANKNRLGRDKYKRSHLVEGHELDWQAMNIDVNTNEDDPHFVTEWHMSDQFLREDQDDVKEILPEGVSAMATKHFRAYYTSKEDCAAYAANCASHWIAEQEAINSDPQPPLTSDLARTMASQREQEKKQNDRPSATSINRAATIMRFRSRLSELTSVQFGLLPEQAWGGEARTTALQLQKALQVSAEYIFTQLPLDQVKFPLDKTTSPPDLAGKSHGAPKAIAWTSSCWFSSLPDEASKAKGLLGAGQRESQGHFTIGFQMYNIDGKWSISSHQLEAVLGLWLWSLKRSGLFLGPTTEEHLTRSKTIVVEKSRSGHMKRALYFWVTKTRQIQETKGVNGMSRPDNLSVPTSTLLSSTQSPKRSSHASGKTDTSESDDFTTISIPTNEGTSLLQMMAQDVYTVFINRIVDIVGNWHDTKDSEKDLSISRHPTSTSTKFPLVYGGTNPHIDALANALISAGVATREEALMSIVPAFLRHSFPHLSYQRQKSSRNGPMHSSFKFSNRKSLSTKVRESFGSGSGSRITE